MSYLLSVIVPVYGVEKYIERCARSLFEQTLDNIEYIFVDDCSPDNSIAILKRIIEDYPCRKSHVRILRHTENKGLPITRQTGMRAATGKWIANCDSDDWVEKEMYEQLVAKGEELNADIAICDFYFDYQSGKQVIRNGFNKRLQDSGNCLERFFCQVFPISVWNKVLRKSLLDSQGVIWPVDTHGEDMALMLQLLYYVKKISYVPVPYYHYIVASDTLTHSNDDDAIIRRHSAMLNNLSKVESFYSTHSHPVQIDALMDYLRFQVRETLAPFLSEKKYFYMWKNTFPNLEKSIILNFRIPLKVKTKMILQALRLVRK